MVINFIQHLLIIDLIIQLVLL